MSGAAPGLRRLAAVVGMLVMLAVPAVAGAHAASTSYLDLRLQQAQIDGQWDIALRDLEEAVGVDADGDGAITWGELRAATPRIQAYALSRLTLADGTQPCELAVRDLQVTEHLDGHYAALLLAGHCARAPADLRLHYELLFELDRLHRGLLKLDRDGVTVGDVFSPQRREIAPATGSVGSVFRTYLHEGIWHVWTGWDHLLFLAALFLPAATRRVRGGWQVAERLRDPLLDSARIVTAFTLAHAATLSVAALGYVHLPTRWVESAVAATVVFAALNNLWPMVQRALPALAVGFGLIHGSAIAGALLELGLPAGARVWALLAFNLGVEIAQLALVGAVVPLGYLLRHRRAWRYGLLLPGSALIAIVGLMWLAQRALLWQPPFALP